MVFQELMYRLNTYLRKYGLRRRESSSILSTIVTVFVQQVQSCTCIIFICRMYIDLTVGDSYLQETEEISKWIPDLDLTMFNK